MLFLSQDAHEDANIPSERQTVVAVISRHSVFVVQRDRQNTIVVAGLLPDTITVFAVTEFFDDQTERDEFIDRFAHGTFRAATLFCNRSDGRETISFVTCAEHKVAVHRKRNRFETEIKHFCIHLIELTCEF